MAACRPRTHALGPEEPVSPVCPSGKAVPPSPLSQPLGGSSPSASGWPRPWALALAATPAPAPSLPWSPSPAPALLRSSWAATHPLAEQPAGSVSDVRCFLVGRGSGALPPHSSRPPPLRVGRRACRCCPRWPACSWSRAFPPPCWPPRPAMPRECLLTQLLGGSGYLCAAGAQAVPSTRQVQGQGWASAMKGVAAHCWCGSPFGALVPGLCAP